MHCTACNSTWKAPGYIRKSKESVTQPNNVITQAAFAGTSSGIKTSVSKQDLKNAGEKRKFSFLNKGQGAGAAQDQKSTSGILKGDSKDFMSFSAAPSSNLSTSNANSLQSLTKGLFARGGTASATAVTKTGSSSGSSGTLTLLELEALSKKNKKKKI